MKEGAENMIGYLFDESESGKALEGRIESAQKSMESIQEEMRMLSPYQALRQQKEQLQRSMFGKEKSAAAAANYLKGYMQMMEEVEKQEDLDAGLKAYIHDERKGLKGLYGRLERMYLDEYEETLYFQKVSEKSAERNAKNKEIADKRMVELKKVGEEIKKIRV